jgi:hypothetical protein
MDTKGLEIVVFDGRYFIYFSDDYSSPEDLGREVVRRIPTNPKEYTGSLNTHRFPNCNLTS